MIDTDGKYYLGRTYDAKSGEATEQVLLYDPEDLTTHAVVVGMTGSGKTGLCIDLLEEAALNNIPALMIDPKGDITNALLHFPELQAEDFLPWINPDEARRADKSTTELAGEIANRWRGGLAQWGISSDRLRALSNAVQFAVYTPGSDAGIPISILASLKAPEIPWQENRELLREKIAGTVTALLGLVGLKDVDPVRSREHIMLANIFETAWSQGQDLDLGELILQTQNPPFEKLGVFDISTFFPDEDRFELAMLLNNILAAPAFQTWIEGQPLNIPELLFTPDGRPRHSVFYIAHLSDAERMFFVTLLYSAVETWMRTQPGSSALKAILYFDEIFGYLPPVANPPSKEPMLRMLKQARAFGVAQVLVTQNPVDIDYKALSNAGTWFIGKLQTDQDKQRLLDGLESAMAGSMDRGEYDRLISSLGKRVFLLHNVHEKQPRIFQTRWAMNYLTGPLTRTQIPRLNALVNASAALEPPMSGADSSARTTREATPKKMRAAADSRPVGDVELGYATRPAIPSGVREFFLPHNMTLPEAFKLAGMEYPETVNRVGILYRPALIAQAQVRFLNRKYDLDYEEHPAALVAEPDRQGIVRWDEHTVPALAVDLLNEEPVPQARFTSLEAPLNDDKVIRTLEKDFEDWIYHEVAVNVRANEELAIYAGPEISQAEFRRMCSEAAQSGRADEIDKVEATFDKRMERIEERLAREERELREDESDLANRKMEEWGTHAENVFSLFSKRKRSMRTSLTKRRMTDKAKADVEESLDAIKDFKSDLLELEKELSRALEDVNRKWQDIVEQETEIKVSPYKKDIFIEVFGVGWIPFHIVQVGDDQIELSGCDVHPA